MRNTTLNYYWLFFTLIGFQVHAQQIIPVSGGNTIGSNGSTSYTVGQLIYLTSSNGNASASNGIQQALEVINTGTNETLSNTLGIEAYPNPTTSSIILKLKNQEGLAFSLFDINGKLISTQKITGTETSINMDFLTAGTYVLKVNSLQTEIKNFKIIKH